jgi:HAD superfamily hydrolase (TIGR01549 family)
MIKAVIFDFGQTLVDSADGFRRAEKEAQRRIYPDFKNISWATFLKTYRKVRQTYQEQSIFSRKIIWQEVYNRFDRSPVSGFLEKFESDYWEAVNARSRIFPETEAVLINLARKYQLALITNTQGQESGGIHRISQFPKLAQYFEVIVVAGEQGVPPKPDPIPFQSCLEKLDIKPDESVYVGDDWRIDVCGATDMGMHPVWLQHETVRRNWPSVETKVPVIHRLDQLLDLDGLFRVDENKKDFPEK